MPDLHFAPLPDVLRPLLNKFYRACQSPMRANAEDRLWVARGSEIVAGLGLRALGTSAADGFWLNGLLVAPAQRQQGLASELVQRACTHAGGPVWLFCHPNLAGFYRRLGFLPTETLPAVLAERLARYQRTKVLVALQRDGQPLVGTA